MEPITPETTARASRKRPVFDVANNAPDPMAHVVDDDDEGYKTDVSIAEMHESVETSSHAFHDDLPKPDRDAIMDDETGHMKRSADCIEREFKVAQHEMDAIFEIGHYAKEGAYDVKGDDDIDNL
jgi:hypothetical protein